MLQELKRLSPQAKCILLLEEVQGLTSHNPADAFILKGTPPENFVRIIENMLEGN